MLIGGRLGSSFFCSSTTRNSHFERILILVKTHIQILDLQIQNVKGIQMAYKEQMAQQKESFWTSRPDFYMELQLFSGHCFQAKTLCRIRLGQELFHPELTPTTAALDSGRAGERHHIRLH